MKKWIVIGVIAALAAGGYYLVGVRGKSAAANGVQFRTGKVERGEVIEGIAASGTVQPTVLVQVGTQISGVIEKILVDFNSKVTAGQTIAILDSRRLAAQLAQDEAAVARATADLERVKTLVTQAAAELERARAVASQSRADVDRVKALLTQAERDLERQKALVERRLTAPADVDAAEASRGSLAAQLTAAEASVRQDEAQIAVAEATVLESRAQIAVGEAALAQAKAQRDGDRVNFDYATIVSPVDGVVVSRNVDVGQTVAASLQAPTLFLIAQDLTKIQVQTSVPEADIGRIIEKQVAHFTVDAHPDRAFDGVVSQVRLASTTVQNVVTYIVIIDAANPDGLLFPGMTANVTFEIARSAPDALRVPATALRLQPAAELLESGGEPARRPDAAPRTPAAGGPRGPEAGEQSGRKPGLIYLLTPERKLRPVPVVPGLSDGINTVVVPLDPSALPEGAEVVTAVLKTAEPAPANPFAPRMGGPRGGGR